MYRKGTYIPVCDYYTVACSVLGTYADLVWLHVRSALGIAFMGILVSAYQARFG